MIANNSEKDYGETLRVNFELKKFNWGAFGFTFLWGIANGYIALSKTLPFAFLFCFAIFLSVFFGYFGLYISGLILAGYMVYCGIYGNQWAYGSFLTNDINSFVANQRRWGYAFGIFAFIIAVYILKHFVK